MSIFAAGMTERNSVLHEQSGEKSIWKRAYQIWLFVFVKGGLTFLAVLLFKEKSEDDSPLRSFIISSLITLPIIPVIAALFFLVLRKPRSCRELWILLPTAMIIFNVIVYFSLLLSGTASAAEFLVHIIPYTLASIGAMIIVNRDLLFPGGKINIHSIKTLISGKKSATDGSNPEKKS